MYKLARHIFVLLLLTAISYTGSAQLRPVIRGPYYQRRAIQRQSRIEQVRESYLGRRLALSTWESERFWPLYRQYQDALTAIRDQRRLNLKAQPDGQQQIENDLKYQTDLLNVRKYYTAEFLKILPPQKVSEMIKAEKEFQDELIKQLKERQITTSQPPPTN